MCLGVRFLLEKKRNADVNVLKNRLLSKAVPVTEKDMVVRFTGDHFELMEPVETTIYPNNDLFLKTLLDIVKNRSYSEAACERLFYNRMQQDAAELFTKFAGRSLELRAFLSTTFYRLSCLDGSVSKDTKQQPELCNVSIDSENILPLQTMLVEERPEQINRIWESGNCKPFLKTPIRKFGNYVFIQLKIFNFEKKTKLSKQQYQQLISKVLTLPTNFKNRNERQQFQLIGTVNHVGEGRANEKETGGHYVAFVRKQDAWYLCNDETIQQNDNYVNPMYGQPYLLFYKRSNISLDAREPLPLSNLGNSCYLNALMQNIINVPELFGISGSAPRTARTSASSSARSSRSGSTPRTASSSASSSARLGRASRRAKQNEQLRKIREERQKYWEQKFKEKQMPPRKKQKVEPSTDTESDTPEVDDIDDDMDDADELQRCLNMEKTFQLYVQTLERMNGTKYSSAKKEEMRRKYYKDAKICDRVYEIYKKKIQNRSLMSLSSMTL